jgi:hypothetical protein
MLTSLWCCRLGVEKLEKFIMTMKKWLVDAIIDYPWKGQSTNEFFMEEVGIIEENDVMLDAIGYFNVDHRV